MSDNKSGNGWKIFAIVICILFILYFIWTSFANAVFVYNWDRFIDGYFGMAHDLIQSTKNIIPLF